MNWLFYFILGLLAGFLFWVLYQYVRLREIVGELEGKVDSLQWSREQIFDWLKFLKDDIQEWRKKK